MRNNVGILLVAGALAIGRGATDISGRYFPEKVDAVLSSPQGDCLHISKGGHSTGSPEVSISPGAIIIASSPRRAASSGEPGDFGDLFKDDIQVGMRKPCVDTTEK